MPDAFRSYQSHTDNAPISEVSERYTYSEVDDLIAKPPSGLLRSGISMIAGFVAIALIMSWIIRYPDVIETPIVLTSTNAPVDMIMKISGVIESIRVQNGAHVKAGDTLIYVRNTANMEDLITWFGIVADLTNTQNPSQFLNIKIIDNLSLGELQQSYRDLSEQIAQYQQLSARNDVILQTGQLLIEISAINDLNASHRRQIELYEAEMHLQEAEFKRAEMLHSEKVISTTEYERAEALRLQVKRQHEVMKSVIFQNETRVAQLKSNILELEATREYELSTAKLKIQESLKTINAGILAWADRYLVLTPISGTVSIPEAIRAQTFVSGGQVLYTVIPGHETQEVYAHLNLPGSRAGKVESGQRTIIRLDAWPYKEYGSLEAEVESVASIPTVNTEGVAGYEVKLGLPHPLTTSYGLTLPYQPRSIGIARIITEDRRVFHRIFESLISLLKNK